MSVKCLCKIGIVQSNEELEISSNIIIHNGKEYEPLINFDYNQLCADISKNRDFCIVGLKCDDAEYCTIFLDGTRQPRKNRESRARILSIVFPEFNTTQVLCQNEDKAEEDQVTKINHVTFKLYDLLRTAHISKESESKDSVIIDNHRFQPTLRDYQRKTINWLFRREHESAKLDNFYKRFTSTEGVECYINLMTLDIKDNLPDSIDIPKGGILADEMGLGKTVEMLALVLLNGRPSTTLNDCIKEPETKKPRSETKLFCVCHSPNSKNTTQCSKCGLKQHNKCVQSYIDSPFTDSDYLCPRCWEQEGVLVPSAATVIVSPSLIKLQWLSEINKHISPPLNVLLYEGVAKHKLSPRELASYDIVLTDYSILRREIFYTAANETNITLRKERRVMRVNSPLVLVDWWRVCLDEAQMESANTQASRIVKQLPAIHRWAVTGTPIEKSLDDLVTLLEFVGLSDVSNSKVWQPLTTNFTRGTTEDLVNVLQKIMWRTCKVFVLEELGIPPQSEKLHFIELNNVEMLFYSDEHAACLSAFHDKIEGYSDLTGVTTKVLNLILQPMLKLRQDCSIPVLQLKNEHNLQKKKKFLQPQELLDHMRTTNETECKNQLRSMASIYNGIAALYFLQKNYPNAIKYYELVLKLSKEYTGPISIDSLLQIHALYNVIQAYRILESKDTSIIEEYEELCNKLEWKYLESYATNLQSAHNGYTSVMKKINESDNQDPTYSAQVWELVLSDIEDKNLDEPLLNKINDEVFDLYSNNVYQSFPSIRTVLLIVDLWYKKIVNIRKELSQSFIDFDIFVQNVRPRNDVAVARWRMMVAFIRSVYDCHLSEFRKKPSMKDKTEDDPKKAKKLCQLCVVEKLLQNYECLIFDKTLDEKTSNAEGTWNPTMQETVLKAVYTFVRHKNSDYAQECEQQIEAINLFKTEYKEFMKLWIEIEYTVKAYDEMDMCKMRISLANSEEEKTNYSIYKHEIEHVLAESKLNFNDAQKEFTLKHARLKYIRHLEKDVDPGPCPICSVEQQNKYVVLECGHHVCLFCIQTMSKLNKSSKLCCAICRHEQKYQNVHYVTRKIVNNNELDVKGDYSSKIQSVVLEVLKLKLADEKVKIIIFSQWQPILKAIGEALYENSITFRLKWCSQSVEEFKDESLGITCILIMLQNGSQGLNLTEASHVFLVEPILNPGEEHQAIGRVHRIGQTKPTTVHRFIVKNTIEENIFNAVSKNKAKKWSNLTIESIKSMFELRPSSS